MSEDIKFDLLFACIVITVGGFFIGITVQFSDPTGCKYQTIASRINPGYFIGCEITKKRW